MKRVLTLLALILGMVPALHAQLNGVTAELRLDQTEYLPDEAMRLNVRVINRSGQELTLGKDNDWITFNIQGTRNFIAQKIGDVPAAGEFTLQSAQAGTRKFNLTPYFDFSRAGRYQISATIKIPQWNQEITCKPVSFMVGSGVPIPGMPELQFGVPLPPGTSNAAPEVRKYVLQKATYLDEWKLYVRLLDANGKTLSVFPIDRMVSFSGPEAQIDRFSNLHVLHQTGAKTFNYSVITPDGQVLIRQTHEYTQTRPKLSVDSEGRIFVVGGMRHIAFSDIPPTVLPTAAIPDTNKSGDGK